MKLLILLLASMIIVGCATEPTTNQTVEFRHFVRDFFEDEHYQMEHVIFPLQLVYYAYDADESDSVVTSKYISRDEWKHYKGPDYYQCEINCYDLVIYDSFEKKHKESGERVLSFEGVSNGINSSLYFKRINGEWYLVKHEEFDN